jgi:hypothetical protein
MHGVTRMLTRMLVGKIIKLSFMSQIQARCLLKLAKLYIRP